jgi:hypothetical protein
VSEWFKVPLSKSGRRDERLVGSNPTPSALPRHCALTSALARFFVIDTTREKRSRVILFRSDSEETPSHRYSLRNQRRQLTGRRFSLTS